ncbi:hypothetical protein NSA18_09615 [Pasteurella caecimuris]|uniref:hypothetical protein n=1 Tax=Rodentibacter caecimuris TaxID=1796644 RepID=UPI00215031A6|nr:hypothetical protein [Pasteurella caecimuris]MCR1838137.1 hypothetical protein [Pasteurella caecimuris]MCU0107485.1 hypothetical protein [Pasteurella caecimuris]
MKKKNQILVTLSIVALLGGCSEEEVQRDVYHSLDDCLADWKKIELCEADKTTENTQTQNVNQQSQNGNSLSGLGLRNNGENTNNNEWQNANQTQTEQNNATRETTANAESNDPSLGAAIAGGVMGYVAARAISNFLGPSYHPGNRAVSTPSGQVIQPQTNRSVGKPMLVKGKAGSMNSKPIARGGFSSPSHSNRSSGG